MNASVAALFMGALLSACTAWPPHGQGGVAEQRVPANSREDLPVELEEQLAALKYGWRFALREGLAACQPARLLELQRQLVSSERNLYGGMPADAQLNLRHAQLMLADLHSQAQQQTACVARREALQASHSPSD